MTSGLNICATLDFQFRKDSKTFFQNNVTNCLKKPISITHRYYLMVLVLRILNTSLLDF
jgi:hypothetical protein